MRYTLLRRTVPGVVCAALCAAAPAWALPKLTLKDALELTFRRHPTIHIAGHETEAARYRVGTAEAAYYPRFFFGAQWIGGSINGNPASLIGFPDIPRITSTGPGQAATNRNFIVPQSNYLTGFSTSVPIYDFGRTDGRVHEAQARVRQGEAVERTVRDRLIVGLRRTYYAVLAARAIVQVAKESVQRLSVYGAQAVERVKNKVGTPIEVPRAQAELAKARGRLVAAENDERVARVILDNAIGERTADKYELVDDREDWRIVASLPELLEVAETLRPEVAEVKGRVDSNRGILEWSEGNYYPALALTGSVNGRGTGGFGNWFNYDIGVVVAWPIFEGNLYKNQSAATRQRLRNLDAVKEELRQRIQLEVRRAHALLQSAEETIAATRVAALHAAENLRLVNARFNAGLGNIIEVADAEELQTTAQAAVVRAIYDYKIVAANLERAVGRSLPKKAP